MLASRFIKICPFNCCCSFLRIGTGTIYVALAKRLGFSTGESQASMGFSMVGKRYKMCCDKLLLFLTGLYIRWSISLLLSPDHVNLFARNNWPAIDPFSMI